MIPGPDCMLDLVNTAMSCLHIVHILPKQYTKVDTKLHHQEWDVMLPWG